MSFTQRSEVIVIGAGPAGLAAAIGCHEAGLIATVVDTSPAASAHAATGRSAALFSTTIAFLARLGVWDRCAPHAEPLRALQFIDDTGRRLRAPDALFKAAEIGEEAFGCNIANADLARALKEIAAERASRFSRRVRCARSTNPPRGRSSPSRTASSFTRRWPSPPTVETPPHAKRRAFAR
jgi:2-octaprenyl-6-methoxyphenol hydroxylase